MTQFIKDFHSWCKEHTAVLLVVNLALVGTLWWNFSYHRVTKTAAEIYDISTTAYAPQSVTLEELMFTRIKKTKPRIDCH